MNYFLMSVILLNIMPGPAMFYVAQQSLTSNVRSIVLSIMGIELGTVLHIVASALGLTLALSKLPLFFVVSKYLCAAFLIYLGLSQLITKDPVFSLLQAKNNDGNTLIKGVILNLLNPKVLLFFLALLPQFINSDSENPSFQIIYLGAIFGLCGGVVNILLSYLVKASINKMKSQSQVIDVMRISTTIISGLFILFGVSLFILALNTTH